MIYKIILIENEGSTGLEEIHVRAGSITEAETKALAYAKREWENMSARVGSIEETSIVIVDDQP